MNWLSLSSDWIVWFLFLEWEIKLNELYWNDLTSKPILKHERKKIVNKQTKWATYNFSISNGKNVQMHTAHKFSPTAIHIDQTRYCALCTFNNNYYKQATITSNIGDRIASLSRFPSRCTDRASGKHRQIQTQIAFNLTECSDRPNQMRQFGPMCRGFTPRFGSKHYDFMRKFEHCDLAAWVVNAYIWARNMASPCCITIIIDR